MAKKPSQYCKVIVLQLKNIYTYINNFTLWLETLSDISTLDKRDCGGHVMPTFFLSEIDSEENWSFDGTYLLAQARDIGCRIPARHPEV